MPDWLAQSQLLFYTGAEFYDKFQQAIDMFESNWPRRLVAQRPLNPDSKSIHGSNHALYDAACDYAQRLAFTDAEKHFDTLVRRNDADYADVAVQWLELVRLYSELIEIDERPNARFIFKKKWANYVALFPKEFLDGIFDPKDFNSRYGIKLSSSPVGTAVIPQVPLPQVLSVKENLKYHTGQNVRHAKFGEGVVIESKRSGGDEEVTISFKMAGIGIKKLAASFANLTVLNKSTLKYHTGQNVRHAKFGDGVVIESKLNRGQEEVTVSFKMSGVGIKRLDASFANLTVLD